MNIKALLSIMALAALTACGDGTATVIGTADMACCDAAGNDVVCSPARVVSPSADVATKE